MLMSQPTLVIKDLDDISHEMTTDFFRQIKLPWNNIPFSFELEKWTAIAPKLKHCASSEL